MINTILEWVAGQVLKYLAAWATREATKANEQIKKDREEGVTNEANIKAYEQARSREERRKAALDLLNRTNP